ncbi:MAG: hypothetical protein K8W52_14740 [Deltaproteobacteria bacterium]|nr:hypothetical protein [Deltaproteobacteria bacterium]
MRTLRSLTIAAALTAIAATGCVQPNDDLHPAARVIPTSEQVAIKLPDKGTARTVGQLAPWYVATRNVTRTLNGGTAWVLVVVHAVVQFPPTETNGDTATWGPWDDGPLAPARYRLTVTALADGSYDWSLDGQNKTNPGSGFISVVNGNAVPSVPEGEGTGHFSIDFDNGAIVNPVDNGDARGTLDVAYDLAARTLDIDAVSAEDRGGVLVPVQYHYTYGEAVDGSGNMTFATHGDTEDAGTAAEDGVVRSRWLATGAGRTDLRLSGGDLGAVQVTASECWDTSFRETYYTDSASYLPTEGDPASCVYADQDLPSL